MKKGVMIAIIIIILLVAISGYILMNNPIIEKDRGIYSPIIFTTDKGTEIPLFQELPLTEVFAKDLAIEYVNNSNLTYITVKKDNNIWTVYLSNEICKGSYNPLEGCFGGITVLIDEDNKKISSS